MLRTPSRIWQQCRKWRGIGSSHSQMSICPHECPEVGFKESEHLIRFYTDFFFFGFPNHLIQCLIESSSLLDRLKLFIEVVYFRLALNLCI